MISQEDIAVHAKYDFNNERTTVLGVVTDNNQQRLGEVRKIDITCWNIFRSWFGFGPLACTKISLPDLSSYFLSENIDTLKAADDESTPETKAHKTLCELATRNMNKQREAKGISRELVSDLRPENFQKLSEEKRSQVVAISQLVCTSDTGVKKALTELKEYLLTLPLENEKTRELLQQLDVTITLAFCKGRTLYNQIRTLESENAPGWQEKAIKMIRQAREDDPKMELERLKGANAYTDHEFSQIEKAVKSVWIGNNSKKQDLTFQAKVQYAQMHEIKRIYEKTHDIFIHGQATYWTLVPQLRKELTRHFAPDKFRHYNKYLRSEVDAHLNLTAYEYQAETRKIVGDSGFDHNLEVRERLISADGYLYNHCSGESALYFMVNNKNVSDDSGIKAQLMAIIREFKKDASFALIDKLATRILQAHDFTKALNTTGNLYVFAVPKEKSADVQYRSHSGGIPCGCHRGKDQAAILQMHQEGIIGHASCCAVAGGHQYRIYYPALEKAEGRAIFRLNGLSRPHRTVIKDVVKQVAAELYAIKILPNWGLV